MSARRRDLKGNATMTEGWLRRQIHMGKLAPPEQAQQLKIEKTLARLWPGRRLRGRNLHRLQLTDPFARHCRIGELADRTQHRFSVGSKPLRKKMLRENQRQEAIFVLREAATEFFGLQPFAK